MSTSLLLAMVLLSADPPFDVQARVVFGAEERELPATDVEPWIAAAIREAGFPKASPASNWVTLARTYKRLFNTERGGTIIDGKITVKDGRMEVEINGCEGAPLVGQATLVAGQQRVIRLTEREAPRDYFVALRAVARNDAPSVKQRGAAEPGRSASTAFVGIRAVPPVADLKFESTQDATIAMVNSEKGIGGTTLERTADAWPQPLRLRLRLRGLESLRLTADDVTVEWSVASTRPHDIRVTRIRGREEKSLNKDDPLFSELRIVADALAIPLVNGYFEVTVPTKLLESNPRSLQLRWIDFYRN